MSTNHIVVVKTETERRSHVMTRSRPTAMSLFLASEIVSPSVSACIGGVGRTSRSAVCLKSVVATEWLPLFGKGFESHTPLKLDWQWVLTEKYTISGILDVRLNCLIIKGEFQVRIPNFFICYGSRGAGMVNEHFMAGLLED